MNNLTEKQIQIIKDTWEIPKKDLGSAGEEIFYQYFKKYPDNQRKFSAFQDMPLESLKGSKVFRWHALRVINIFQKAVDAFDTDDATGNLLKIWEKVAQNHINRRISKESFNELKGILLDVMTAACSLDQEGQEAWLALIDNIYAIIFANYDASMQ